MMTVCGTGIEYLSFSCCHPFHRADYILTPGEFFWLRNDHIEWHGDVMQRPADRQALLANRSFNSHHHQQVDVAVRPGLPARVGPEQDDLFRCKLPGDAQDGTGDTLLRAHPSRDSWHGNALSP